MDNDLAKVVVGSIGMIAVCGVVAITGQIMGLWALVLVAFIVGNVGY